MDELIINSQLLSAKAQKLAFDAQKGKAYASDIIHRDIPEMTQLLNEIRKAAQKREAGER